MAFSRLRSIVRPALYVTAAGIVGGSIYAAYRPRNIPGSEAATVPPPTYGERGVFQPPKFPHIKSREEQIEDLKRSSGPITRAAEQAKDKVSNGHSRGSQDASEEAPYDLLIIGGGATGTGIALDAATRGLRVALVERDDYSSGTSSKSTKLVHGGVRYLEKAVRELDFNQYVVHAKAISAGDLTCPGTNWSEKLCAREGISWIQLRTFHAGYRS